MVNLLKLEATVVRNEYITPTVFELELKPDTDLPFQAGQFLQITLNDPRTEGKNIKRAYSILSSPLEKNITLCIKLVEDGLGTPQLVQKQVGEKLQLTGPFGKFVYKSKERSPFFISTGTGIAPFYSMLKTLQANDQIKKDSFCLLGVREETEVLYDKYFSSISELTWIPAVSKPTEHWSGLKGRVTECIYNMKDHDFKKYDYYLCGNGAMIKECKSYLLDKGVDKTQIFQEIYFTS